jgi:hypothetical protein
MIDETLKRYLNFEEWIIDSIDFQKFGTSIRIELYYPLTEKFEVIHGEKNYRRCVFLFEGVQEFQMENHLSSSIIENLQEINWGLNEIALFKIVKASETLKKYADSKVPLIESAFLWENDRRIRIISANVTVEEIAR